MTDPRGKAHGRSAQIPGLVILGVIGQTTIVCFHAIAKPADGALADMLLWFPYIFLLVLGALVSEKDNPMRRSALLALPLIGNGLLLSFYVGPALCSRSADCFIPISPSGPLWIGVLDWLFIAALQAGLGIIGAIAARIIVRSRRILC